MQTVPKTLQLRNLTSTSSDLLKAQLDWLTQLADLQIGSAAVPTLQAQIEAELNSRAADHIAILASIKPLTRGYVAMREWGG